jgi:hypothetical protein
MTLCNLTAPIAQVADADADAAPCPSCRAALA